MKKSFLFLAAILFFMATAVSAATINWTDWTSASTGSPGSAAGTINGTNVTYSGEVYFAQLGSSFVGPGSLTNYWTEPVFANRPYTGNSVVANAPTPAEMIALNSSSVINTLTFSQPLLDPVMAIVSMGQTGAPVSYGFSIPFIVLSSGIGYWNQVTKQPSVYQTLGTSILLGQEFHGAIQFVGSLSSISWTSSAENWHGFTVGAVPIPAAAWLLGTGLVGLVVLRRKFN